MVGFTSCSKKSDSKGGSKATGWKVNDKKGGFQYASQNLKSKLLDQVWLWLKVEHLPWVKFRMM